MRFRKSPGINSLSARQNSFLFFLGFDIFSALDSGISSLFAIRPPLKERVLCLKFQKRQLTYLKSLLKYHFLLWHNRLSNCIREDPGKPLADARRTVIYVCIAANSRGILLCYRSDLCLFTRFRRQNCRRALRQLRLVKMRPIVSMFPFSKLRIYDMIYFMFGTQETHLLKYRREN